MGNVEDITTTATLIKSFGRHHYGEKFRVTLKNGIIPAYISGSMGFIPSEYLSFKFIDDMNSLDKTFRKFSLAEFVKDYELIVISSSDSFCLGNSWTAYKIDSNFNIESISSCEEVNFIKEFSIEEGLAVICCVDSTTEPIQFANLQDNEIKSQIYSIIKLKTLKNKDIYGRGGSDIELLKSNYVQTYLTRREKERQSI